MFFQPRQAARNFRAGRAAAALKRAHKFLAVVTVASFMTAGSLMSTRAELTDAAAGQLDPTFSGDGKVTTDFFHRVNEANAVAIQPDGKIVVVGTTVVPSPRTIPLTYTDFAVARYNTNGQLDQTFGTGGRVTTHFGSRGGANDVLIQPDNKILVSGFTRADSGIYFFALARYNPDGELDQTFGSGGKVMIFDGQNPFTSGANAIALQPDGKIVAVGGGVFDFDFVLARFNSDGSLDDGTASDSTPGDSFGNAGTGTVDTDLLLGNGTANDVVLQPDGKIVVVGGFSDFLVARYNTDGSLDSGFGTNGEVLTEFLGGYDAALAVALQPDGKIVVAGQANYDNQHAALARYNPDGQLDQSFSTDGKLITDFPSIYDRAEDVVIQTDGKIVIATFNFGLARYNKNGGLDPSFGNGGKVTTDFFGFGQAARALALQPDGRIVVAGFASPDPNIGNPDFAIARYKNDALSITPPLISLTLSSPIVSACGSITGVITLASPAPPRSAYVTLSSTNEAASVPTQIMVPAGETTQSFTINIRQGTTIETGNIIARLGSSIKTAQLIVKPIGISSLRLTPNPVEGPGPATGVIELSCAAPEGGIVVTLASNNPAIASPVLSSITIPAGAQVKSFTVRVADVTSPRTALITATANGISKSALLTVQ